MRLRTLMITENECYKSGKKFTPKGIMIHSTAANNPNLKRYVGPDDGLLGYNKYNNHWNHLHPGGEEIGPHKYGKKNGKCAKCGGRQVACHAFIGKLKDGSIATYQIMPWNMKAWHAGGKANDTHIGFEICEDDGNDPAYLAKVYKEAVDLCAYLCKRYRLDPMADGVILCHADGYKRGIASNHGDVLHWWPKHGYSVAGFRRDVYNALKEDEAKEWEILVKEPAKVPEVGQTVYFTGDRHYTSAASKAARRCKPGKAKITAKAITKAHPYHLIGVPGEGSTVYGWVNAEDIQIID